VLIGFNIPFNTLQIFLQKNIVFLTNLLADVSKANLTATK